jgi:hypothetical protein
MRVVAHGPVSPLNPENAQTFDSLLISADRALETGDRDSAIGCIDEIYRIFDSKESSVADRCGADAQVRNT